MTKVERISINKNKINKKSNIKADTKIFILHPTGRLSKEDIERMVQEAEQFKAEDEIQKEKVTAKNSLESLAFNMKSTVEDEKLQDKISPEDKKTIVDKCNEVIAWLDRNQVNPNSHQGEKKCAFYKKKECNCVYFLLPRRLKRMSMNTSRRS